MATELTETFFENVNRFMRENNLSKPKIALKLGGSKALFYTWENRKIISDTYLRRICDLMGTTKKRLLGGCVCQKKDDAKEPQTFIKCITQYSDNPVYIRQDDISFITETDGGSNISLKTDRLVMVQQKPEEILSAMGYPQAQVG